MALTRAQRRALQKESSGESEKQQSTDLSTETTPQVNYNETSTDQQVAKKDKKVLEKQESESEASSDSSDNEEQDEQDDNESSSEEEESSDDDSSEEEDDDDLDALLEQAEKALTKQQLGSNEDQIKLDTEEEANDKKFNLPKMDSRITIDNELYIKRAKGEKVARLVDGTVDVIDHDDNKKNRKHKKVVEAIKEREKEEKERLSRKQRKEEREKTAGRGWFDMGRPDMTPELKRDLQLLKMRHVIDRKRHYKKMGKDAAKYFQVGTVIEGATEFHSSRLTRKERKETIVDELMANEQAKDYYKRKYNEGQVRGNNGRKKAKRQMKRL